MLGRIEAPLNEPLAVRTIECAKAGMQSGRSSCLPELVQLIHALSAKAREISVMELADIVQKHVTVMAKVITAANTLGYNPSGIEISNVSQAIQVVGFERIRSLVTSLVLVHQAVDNTAAEDERGAAMLALCSGLTAQHIAGERRLANPEQAFVAASLRNFGRLLLATYLTDQYHEAQRLAAEKPGNAAYRQIFGLTPLELGYELLQSPNLPATVLDALREFSPQTLETINAENVPLLVVAEFAVKLCELALDRELTNEAFHRQTRDLSARFEEYLSFTPEDTTAVLTAVSERMAQFLQSLGFSSYARDIVELLRWRAGGNRPVTPAAAPRPAPVAVSPEATPGTPASQALPSPRRTAPPTPPPENPSPAALSADDSPNLGELVEIERRSWDEGIDLLSRCLEETRPDFAKIQRLALEHVQKGFRAPEAVLLSVESDHRNYVATLGQGRLIRSIRGDRAVRRDERTVFGICLSRRDNVVIHNTADPRIAPYLPAWCAGKRGLGAFVAMPLHDEGLCFALIIVGWLEPRQIIITPEQGTLLRSLLVLVGTAYRQTGGA